MLLSDKGPRYTGKAMGEFPEAWSAMHITAPVGAPFPNGIIERQVGLVKQACRSARSSDLTDSDARIMEHVTMGKNLVPSLTTGIPPIMAMSGRADMISSLEDCPEIPELSLVTSDKDSALTTQQRHVRLLFNIRSEISMLDAQKAIGMCGNRRLRAGSGEF